MLENYEMLSNGVIRQINIGKQMEYDKSYIDNSYNSYGELSKRMSYLRLGFILGALDSKPYNILDIGYGNGDFLSACKDFIPTCYGYDINGCELPGECISFNEFDNIFNWHFDVVCFFDSLEHFRDINFVKDLKADYICISVPECHYKSDEWFKQWKHRKPDEHLWHFNRVSLMKFMDEMGFNAFVTSNIEDTIRKPVEPALPNILTMVFENKNI